MDFYSQQTPSRILLQLSNPTNERMIQQHLSGGYTFLDGESDAENSLSTTEFDLCILDSQQFSIAKNIVADLKDEASPVYLPVILLVKDQDINKYLNPNLGKLYDDILPLPISPPVLESRIESLCEQRQRSLEMRKKTYLANRAINATDIGICITDYSQDDNPLVFINDGFESLTGYNEDEVLGRNCRFLQGEDNNQTGVRQLRESIDNGESTKVLIRNYKKDGTLFWNEVSVSPINSSNGESEYFVGIQNNVTELIEAQNELKELVDEKQVLLQEVHHRIKNNLAVIVALLELKILNSNSKETKSSLKETRTRIFSIAKVHELLYEHDQLNKIEFREYIKSLVEHLNSVYSRTSENLEFQLNLEHLLLSLDQAVPCGMLLSELITNVYKHGFDEGEKGRVEISLKETDGWMQVMVKDNGRGLPGMEKLEDTDNFSSSIIHTLLKQLQAKSNSKSEDGFQFTFSFELKNYAGIVSE